VSVHRRDHPTAVRAVRHPRPTIPPAWQNPRKALPPPPISNDAADGHFRLKNPGEDDGYWDARRSVMRPT
jgi:hypothetical protein